MIASSSSSSPRNDLATLFGVGALGLQTDAELLARFVAGRGEGASEAAFSTLVARHGPMVLGVCRRVLNDPHAASDAFQATFLILVRKAPTVRVEDSLGRWLHGVSLRVARRARQVATRRHGRVRELGTTDVAAPSPASDDLADVRAVIDEEIARLAPRYRDAVRLCYLEGITQEQAAARLGCPVGTSQSRLHRARERLRFRLARRGLAPASWGAATLASATAIADMPHALLMQTSKFGTKTAIVSAAATQMASLAIRGSLLRMVRTFLSAKASSTRTARAERSCSSR